MPRLFPAFAVALVVAFCTACTLQAETVDFDRWLEELRAEARSRGVSENTLSVALRDVRPIERIIELDRHQPEFTQTVSEYLGKRVSEQRIARGRELLRTHAPLLREVEARFGVPPEILVAFWGLESNFGDTQGSFPVISALATLAYDGRRSDRFRPELFDALAILDEGAIRPAEMLGSWAGAMGQPQFMPSTFRAYAIDYDGNGRRDIWTNLPDVFGSAANFLANLGWQRGQGWGREVRLPQGIDFALLGRGQSRPVAEWHALGVRAADGSPIPDGEGDGAIVLPAGHRGPAFLLYPNFQVIMRWNPSTLYAISVGHLADRLRGEGPLQTLGQDEPRPLGRVATVEMQELLNRVGIDAGKPDGVVGPMTRQAVRQFQQSEGLVADGFPTQEILTLLRRRARTTN